MYKKKVSLFVIISYSCRERKCNAKFYVNLINYILSKSYSRACIYQLLFHSAHFTLFLFYYLFIYLYINFACGAAVYKRVFCSVLNQLSRRRERKREGKFNQLTNCRTYARLISPQLINNSPLFCTKVVSLQQQKKISHFVIIKVRRE